MWVPSLSSGLSGPCARDAPTDRLKGWDSGLPATFLHVTPRISSAADPTAPSSGPSWCDPVGSLCSFEPLGPCHSSQALRVCPPRAGDGDGQSRSPGPRSMPAPSPCSEGQRSSGLRPHFHGNKCVLGVGSCWHGLLHRETLVLLCWRVRATRRGTAHAPATAQLHSSSAELWRREVLCWANCPRGSCIFRNRWQIRLQALESNDKD